ncbi:hypothetical protein HPB49_006426 [Dermacentor silvarum]|uniref:Uncharacterized protein n=1 Tax=Dermacentor silvarum TaxID=543639 RepID=A0ACB8C7M1_DERSI|nr:hypothetical protein HPB49_006426 [Dermacentor silvarum]
MEVLEGGRSAFWRPQRGKPSSWLATAEAVHLAITRLLALQGCAGHVDDLLFFFKFFYAKIRSRYSQDAAPLTPSFAAATSPEFSLYELKNIVGLAVITLVMKRMSVPTKRHAEAVVPTMNANRQRPSAATVKKKVTDPKCPAKLKSDAKLTQELRSRPRSRRMNGTARIDQEAAELSSPITWNRRANEIVSKNRAHRHREEAVATSATQQRSSKLDLASRRTLRSYHTDATFTIAAGRSIESRS